MPKANRPIGSNNKAPYTFSDEKTKRKMRRHIKDITDVITEKDIKDVKIPGAEPVPVPAKLTKKEKKELDKKKVDDTPGDPATPWDILQG
jgi:hypothetical protein